jgi:tRNA1Val (adenine37-N6)-methyltransferase
MPNPYFQFKQFRIQQDLCAMKVCTDACIQGALAAKMLSGETKKDLHILDIGTGTGLLTLMLAQQLRLAHFDAIEVNENAYLQAEKNFGFSPWQDRIKLFQGDVRHHSSDKTYNFIICNPPFYENDLKSASVHKNQAMHATSLTQQELLISIKNNLADKGSFCVMYPYSRTNIFINKAAEFNFYPKEILQVKQSSEHPFFRSIIFFSSKQQSVTYEEFCIRDKAGDYTKEFIALLKPYYLHL